MKNMKAVMMAAMVVMIAMLAGCGDGSSTLAISPVVALEASPEMGMAAAARPTAVPGQVEVVAFLPTVPTMQPFVWFTIERTDMAEPVLATLSGWVVAVNPATGEAKIHVDGLNQGGDYIVNISTAIPGTNPPEVEPDSAGNPGAVMKKTLTFRAVDMVGLW